jgi:hypothetical protein
LVFHSQSRMKRKYFIPVAYLLLGFVTRIEFLYWRPGIRRHGSAQNVPDPPTVLLRNKTLKPSKKLIGKTEKKLQSLMLVRRLAVRRTW